MTAAVVRLGERTLKGMPGSSTLAPVAALSLIASVGLQDLGPIPLAVALLTGVAALAEGLVRFERIQKVALITIGIYLLILVSGLTVGGITLPSLASLNFYDTDGRVLLYYLPLLVLSAIRVTPREAMRFARGILFLSGAVSIMLGAWLLGSDGGLFSGGGLFRGLIGHKTSAATIYLTLSIVLFAVGRSTGRRPYMVIAATTFGAALATGSRQALVGLLSMVVLAQLHDRSVRSGIVRLRYVLIGVVIAAILLPVLSPDAATRITRVFDDDSATAVFAQFEEKGWNPSRDLADQLVLSSGGEFNLLGRVAYQKRAGELASDSWLLGAGFGRYNDPVGDECFAVSLPPVACFRTGPQKFTQANAHNSTLQILAELGLIGLVLFGMLWWSLYRRVGRQARLLEDPWQRALASAAQLLILMLPGSMLLGDALAAPSLGIPILTVCAVALGLVGSEQTSSGRVVGNQAKGVQSHPQLGFRAGLRTM